MARKYEAFPGMEDILPGEVEKWQWLEERARIFLESRGFKEIRTPLLEPTELFSRSIGEASDIVHKEMYTFEDRGGRSMTLRPEMTASVARAVIEKGLLTQAKSLRLYYLGPMFRAERPQAGRRRQFHQIGVEMVNEAGLHADFEAIATLNGFLKHIGLNPAVDYELRINDLGSLEDQKKSAIDLKKYFADHREKLCPDCQWRLQKNVMRIFDCKVESCQPIIMKSTWDRNPSKDLDAIRDDLDQHNIRHQSSPRLVRGLDYYNGIVFEVCAKGLGAQDAVAGGGRYDGLYAELGGSDTPCTGFSIGLERLLTVLEKQAGDSFNEQMRHLKVYMAPLDESCKILGICLDKSLELREQGIRVETTPGETSLSKHLKRANQLGLRFVLILGPDEVKKGLCTVKDLDKKKQEEVVMSGIAGYLKGAVEP